MNFDLLHGFLEGAISVKIGKQFLVTYRVQSVKMAFGIQRLGFFQKTLLHHYVHPLVDALDERLSVPKQGVFLDVEVAVDGVAATEG